MNRTIIIAEAGVNHNGDIKLAKQLIDVAASAGADYVKFQTFKANKVASRFAAKANYQQQNTNADETQLEMLKKLELDENAHHLLIGYCADRNIHFLSTAFDFESVDLLRKAGIKLGKIPSGEITNLPYLRKMAASFDELIVSTGMSDMDDIKAALQVLTSAGFSKEKITVLHCNTEYPTPFEDVNLSAMQTIAGAFQVKVGYSDHTAGIAVPVAAVALGATLIEKHFTLDRNLEGPDHKASLEPGELHDMIKAIRQVEKAIGTPLKQPSPSELKNKAITRKSIVAARDIIKGEKFTPDNLTVKRPGSGISPMQWDVVMGRSAPRDFSEDELIEL